jgi:hypothetical protein
MVQLKEKTLEELKKMASKKKISGRSKMNKSQLIRALSKKKMVGGGSYNIFLCIHFGEIINLTYKQECFKVNELYELNDGRIYMNCSSIVRNIRSPEQHNIIKVFNINDIKIDVPQTYIDYIPSNTNDFKKKRKFGNFVIRIPSETNSNTNIYLDVNENKNVIEPIPELNQSIIKNANKFEIIQNMFEKNQRNNKNNKRKQI